MPITMEFIGWKTNKKGRPRAVFKDVATGSHKKLSPKKLFNAQTMAASHGDIDQVLEYERARADKAAPRA